MGSDDLHHKRKEAQAKNKVRNRQAQRIWIVTEGQTEEIYFADLKDDHRLTNVVIERSPGSDAGSIYEYACKLGKKAHREGIGYTHIFCVFDLDTEKTTGAFDVIQKINTTQHKFCSNMHAINSYPCFEVWYLMHFLYSDKPYVVKGNRSVGDCFKSQLKLMWQKEFKTTYSETLRNTYTLLKGRRDAGGENADRLLKAQQETNNINPITNVHELVSFLEKLSTKTKPTFTFTRIEK